MDSINNDALQKDALKLSFTIEKFLEATMLHHFYLTGTLAPYHSLRSICNEDEYISGALGLAQELARYAVNRATEVIGILYSYPSYGQ